MAMTLFELKQQMHSIAQTIESKAAKLAEKAAGAEGSLEDLEKDQGELGDLQKRFDILKTEHDRVERAQIASLEQQQAKRVTEDPEKTRLKSTGDFLYDAMTSGVFKKEYEGLGAIPEADPDLGFGENLLPITMSNELIQEPLETNSLREIEQYSNETGLIEPIIDFEINDADLEDITDKDTATEIEMKANQIKYGRHLVRIVATVKNTVLYGTRTALASSVMNALRSGMAIQEKMRAFDMNPDEEHEHMSYYKVGIKKIYRPNIIKAIIACLGDLNDMFAGNASVVMRRQDYFDALDELINENATYWGKKPEDVIGAPVRFNDRAVIPVVGDYRFAKTNYDIGPFFDTDKNAKKGENYFICEFWNDRQVKLKSAFRLAIVGTDPANGGVTIASATITGTAKVGETLTAGATYSTGSPSADLKYQWKISNAADGKFTNIKNATDKTYSPSEKDVDKFIKVSITASGAATGNALSTATAAVAAADAVEETEEEG